LRDQPEGGLGLGLTLVRRLVELHGGQVEALSEGLGLGTEVVIRLSAGAGASRVGPT
jgi:signal transduction histidine kinase